MSTISITRLYDLLSAKVGKETAQNLTEYIEEKVSEELETKSSTLANKEDLSKLDARVAKLDTKISETKAEIIKWMFIFWVGQVAVTFGFILLFLNK